MTGARSAAGVRVALGLLAAAGVLVAVTVAWTGGVAFTVGGVRVRASGALRPMLVAAGAAAAYVWVSGLSRVVADVAVVRRRLTPAVVAGLAAAGAAAAGLASHSWTAGGPDTFCYVTQADLALAGRVAIAVPVASEAPWPNPIDAFTPFGYAPTADRTAIAPITGPGLPWMMALVEAVAGHAASFVVVPLSAALLVWLTFAIGRRLVSGRVGAAAAAIVATSPTVLAMITTPMSDVPAAACWALATLLLLRDTRRADVAAGAAAGLALLVRPNLLPVAVAAGLWILLARGGRRPARAVALAAFVAGAAPACLAIAVLNTALFGGPLTSGYGRTADLFSLGHLGSNAVRYTRWLVETQTPLALAGLVALLVPAARLWPTDDARRGARLLAAMSCACVAFYLVYLPFDAWWFLRFLLPAWPAMAVGTAALVAGGFAGWPAASATSRAVVARGLAAGTIAGLVVFGLGVTWTRDVFPGHEGERRYATIAQLVERATEPDAVVLAGMMAGPVRYYAGRLTMRFDVLDAAWLDRAVAWWRSRGRRMYVLIEDWEMPAFRARFGAGGPLGRLELAPVLAYRAHLVPGTVYLYDPARPGGPTVTPAPIENPRPRALSPSPRWLAP